MGFLIFARYPWPAGPEWVFLARGILNEGPPNELCSRSWFCGYGSTQEDRFPSTIETCVFKTCLRVAWLRTASALLFQTEANLGLTCQLFGTLAFVRTSRRLYSFSFETLLIGCLSLLCPSLVRCLAAFYPSSLSAAAYEHRCQGCRLRHCESPLPPYPLPDLLICCYRTTISLITVKTTFIVSVVPE
ncbi:hypothetical protein DENSPDRAFT_240693 [Dentipellis sp. KUC8613]|nr:hypothetical protein DENSPDRAFT_240693 [Dentipellis sp. KUC8613]